MTTTPETESVKPNIRTYAGRIDLNLDTIDKLQNRGLFITYATLEADRMRDGMVDLMVKEYDERMAAEETESK